MSGVAAPALVAASPSQLTRPAMTPPRCRPSISSSSLSSSMLLYVDGSRRCRSDALHATKPVRRQWRCGGAAAAAGGGGRGAQLLTSNPHSAARSCCTAGSRPRTAGWPAQTDLVLLGGREAARLHMDISQSDQRTIVCLVSLASPAPSLPTWLGIFRAGEQSDAAISPTMHPATFQLCSERSIDMSTASGLAGLRPPPTAPLQAWSSRAHMASLNAAPHRAGHAARAGVRAAAKRNAGGARAGQQRRKKSQQE